MDNEYRVEASRPQINKGCVPAKDCGVSELEDCPKESWCEWSIRMAETELVEMMDMCNTEVKWRKEDQLPE